MSHATLSAGKLFHNRAPALNAADRSRRTRAATSALSMASRMSESTRRVAVSVEWRGLKPDWSDGTRWQIAGIA